MGFAFLLKAVLLACLVQTILSVSVYCVRLVWVAYNLQKKLETQKNFQFFMLFSLVKLLYNCFSMLLLTLHKNFVRRTHKFLRNVAKVTAYFHAL